MKITMFVDGTKSTDKIGPQGNFPGGEVKALFAPNAMGEGLSVDGYSPPEKGNTKIYLRPNAISFGLITHETLHKLPNTSDQAMAERWQAYKPAGKPGVGTNWFNDVIRRKC